jgi:hypothetical protein
MLTIPAPFPGASDALREAYEALKPPAASLAARLKRGRADIACVRDELTLRRHFEGYLSRYALEAERQQYRCAEEAEVAERQYGSSDARCINALKEVQRFRELKRSIQFQPNQLEIKRLETALARLDRMVHRTHA